MSPGEGPPLRVALDVTLAAERQDEHVKTIGITRVTSEVFEIQRHDPRLAMTLVAASGVDACRGGVLLERLVARDWSGQAFDPGFRPRRLPFSTYRRLYPPKGDNRALMRLIRKSTKIADARVGLRPDAYDVFHSTFMPLPSAASTGRAARVISVYDVIPLTDQWTTTPEIRDQARRTLASIDPQTDHVVVNSAYVRQQLLSLISMPDERVSVVPLAAGSEFERVSPSQIAAACKTVGVEPGRYVLSVASTQPRKNLPLLVRAWARLNEDGQAGDLTWLSVGGDAWLAGPYKEELTRHPAARRSLLEAGYVPDELLPGLYGGALAFVFPSKAEGFGLPIVEAMKAGCPVVAVRASATPEVVGDSGILVDPDDESDLANQLARLIADASFRLQLANRARARARCFDWARTAEGISDVYRVAAAATVNS